MAHAAVKTYCTVYYEATRGKIVHVAAQETYEAVSGAVGPVTDPHAHTMGPRSGWLTVTNQYGQRVMIRKDRIVEVKEA